EIDHNTWSTELVSRRVQHYGYKYDYRARQISSGMYLGGLPNFTVPLTSRLVEDGHFSKVPDQIIVNEYLPGQGIAHHVDCVPCFGETIASLSLGSACEMEFRHIITGETKFINLEPLSLLILTGQARYKWLHAIRARTSDRGVMRQRRVSLTFRTV